MRRHLFGVPAILGLIVGMTAGLARVGVLLPGASLAALHGPLMVGGFLGTVIGLERAVALGKRWGYLAPGLCTLGVLGLVLGLPAGGLFLGGAVALVLLFGALLWRDPALPTAIMMGGALFLAAGQAAWLAGATMLHVSGLWGAGLVLTIAGERLELTRMMGRPRWVEVVFVCVLTLLAVGSVAQQTQVVGASLVGTALWLLRYDLARRTLGQGGLTGYIAAALVGGYLWLGVGGLLWLWGEEAAAGPLYDARLHTLFVGFILAMIFGHAPVVLPAVLGGPPRFHRVLYLPLAFLHLGLLLRVGGDLLGHHPGRVWGSLLNVATVLVFAGAMGGIRVLGTAPAAPFQRPAQKSGG